MRAYTYVLGALVACGIFLLAPLAHAGPSYQVYAEALNTDSWSSTPWGATVTRSTTQKFKGAYSAKTVYTSAMGVFKQTAVGGFSTNGYRNLTFAVYNAGNADDLWFVAETTGGQIGTYLRVADYTDAGGFALNRWTWVRIPVYFMGLGSAPTLKYFSVASGKSGATAYFDEVQFSSNVTLYEGIRYNYYTSQYAVNAPGSMLWYWAATISPTYKRDNNYRFAFTTTETWGGGIQFQQRVGDLYSPDYGAVTVRFLPSDPYTNHGCRHTLALTDSNGSIAGNTVCLDERYMPNLPDGAHFEADGWRHMTIPMSDLVSSPTFLGGAVIQSSAQGDRVEVDDVRFVQKLRWMMPEVARDIREDADTFGEHWLSDYCDDHIGEVGYRKIHTGNDYTDAAVSGRKVYAASRGFVRQLPSQGSWGYAVVIQHETGFTTSYLHLNAPSLNLNQEVQRGALLGTTKYITNGAGTPISHLHFGMRLAEFDSLVSQAGALPEMSCAINDKTYPAFSSMFINSQRLDW